MQRKFIVRQLYTLACMAFTVWALIFVICSEITTFHFVLYQRRKYITVDTIITQNLIPKLIFGTVLIVLGIFCYVFYLTVLRENTLLIVVRFLFYSAGLISCLWEYETMFYISRPSRVLWIRQGDILFVLVNYTFLELLRSEGRLIHLERLFRFFRLATAACVCAVYASSARESLKLDFLYAAVLWIVCGIYVLKMSRNREKLVYALFFMEYLFISGLFFSMRTSDDLFGDRHRILLLAYFLLFSAVLVYLYYYRKFHLRMCLSKDVNQKVKFANKYKYEITNKLIEAVENPIHLIEGLNEILAEGGTDETRTRNDILDSVNHEISRIKKSLTYLKNNSLLVEYACNMEKVKVSFGLIIKQVAEALEGDPRCAGRCVFRSSFPRDTFISCDPYDLTEALVNIVKELIGVSAHHCQVQIVAEGGDDGGIRIKMQTSCRQEERKRVKQMYYLFRRRALQQNTYNEEDIYLISARNTVLLHSGSFQIRKDNRSVILQCRFPECSREEPDGMRPGNVSIGEKVTGGEDGQVIVLISNKAEQIALISSYLSMEPFHLQVFSAGEEAVDYLNRTPEVVLVLIGEVLFNMTYFEISSEIRKNFSLAQLSVVLISSRKGHYMNDSKLRCFNDILEEPPSRHQFLLKVYGAIRVRQSEEELLKYRMDFLQSQMNPHFVFNTISTIMPLCLNRPMEAYSLLEYFAEYLRGNLYAGNLHTQVALHREVDLIDAFLNIEKVRFKGFIESSIRIECDENTTILPLLIEPLVENCVVHARVPGEILHIRVCIQEEGGILSVSVRDDGAGMSGEQIAEICRMNNTNSFGLANVIKRLRLYYQEELQIVSEPGKGTDISFRIPGKAGFRQGKLP